MKIIATPEELRQLLNIESAPETNSFKKRNNALADLTTPLQYTVLKVSEMERARVDDLIEDVDALQNDVIEIRDAVDILIGNKISNYAKKKKARKK